MELTVGNRINEEHRLARQCADTAIEHAIKCGELLTEKKAQLDHGDFKPWIENNCEFSYRRAARYMQVHTKSVTHDTFDFKSINSALGYDKKKEEPVIKEEEKDPVKEKEYEDWCKANEVVDDDEVVDDPPVVSVVTVADSSRSVADYCAEQAIGRLDDLKLNDPGAVEAITKVINHCNKLMRKIK